MQCIQLYVDIPEIKDIPNRGRRRKKPTELNITAGEKKISPISQEDLSIFISKHIVMLVWNG